MSDNFQSDFLKAIDNRGKDDIADVVGMPDDQDLETLRSIIQKFDAKYPGLIKNSLQAGRRDYKLGVHAKKELWQGEGIISKDSNMTYAMELPANLYFAIEQVFPSMFKSKKHFAWFKKNFRQLTISGN